MKDISSFSVLIVDDDKFSGELLAKKLTKKGLNTSFVSTSAECLERVEKNKPDLILLDIMMPDVSGLETLSEIRKTYNNFELPIVMVTAKDEVHDLVNALREGANDFISKPVNIDVAMARVITQLKIKELVELNLDSRQISTASKMVTTLNHEISNPLTIATINLELYQREHAAHDKLIKVENALKRITKTIKRVEALSQDLMKEVDYSENSTMYDIEE